MGNDPTLFDPSPPPTRPCPTCAGRGWITDEEMRRMIADRPGQVGRFHPNTAKRAANRRTNIVRFGTQRYKVLAALVQKSGTAAEVALGVGLSRNQTATRLGELRETGHVAYLRNEDGLIIERPTGPNDTGLVQTITALGRAAVSDAQDKR